MGDGASESVISTSADGSSRKVGWNSRIGGRGLCEASDWFCRDCSCWAFNLATQSSR